MQKKIKKFFVRLSMKHPAQSLFKKNVAEMWHFLFETAIFGWYWQQWQKNIGNLILSSDSRKFG